jgi:hypothetical protein
MRGGLAERWVQLARERSIGEVNAMRVVTLQLRLR